MPHQPIFNLHMSLFLFYSFFFHSFTIGFSIIPIYLGFRTFNISVLFAPRPNCVIILICPTIHFSSRKFILNHFFFYFYWGSRKFYIFVVFAPCPNGVIILICPTNPISIYNFHFTLHLLTNQFFIIFSSYTNQLYHYHFCYSFYFIN